MRIYLLNAETGETVLEVNAEDDRLWGDYDLIAETAEQAIADFGGDFRVVYAHVVGFEWLCAIAYVEPIEGVYGDFA